MTRKQFLQTATGAAAVAVLPAAAGFAATEKKGPKRGVSVYSYAYEIDLTATMEDCLAEIGELGTPGQKMGVEILANGHVDGYPNPSAAWVKKWHEMCAKYEVLPVELGHWVDSKLYNEGPEGLLDTKDSVEKLVADIRLANRLGFTRGRTKLGMLENDGMPTKNWREIVKAALPVAEKNNFRMLTEFHSPTPLKGRVMDEYLDFITKEKCTPWFGINVDFSVFQTRTAGGGMGGPAPAGGPGGAGAQGGRGQMPAGPLSQPEDIIPILPYVHCCHAKFNSINRDCEDQSIPYREILKILVDRQWDGYLLSEYEGADKPTGGAWSAVRRQHVLMKRLLGEA
jgi:sugar phosphate isomerase/epimerase